jgi:hypothetical protein
MDRFKATPCRPMILLKVHFQHLQKFQIESLQQNDFVNTRLGTPNIYTHLKCNLVAKYTFVFKILL